MNDAWSSEVLHSVTFFAAFCYLFVSHLYERSNSLLSFGLVFNEFVF